MVDDVSDFVSNVLFLDDSEDRHVIFRNLVDSKTKLHAVYTVDEAISCLDKIRFYQVFLDHDLCEEDIMCVVGKQTKYKTGMAVVDYLLTMPKDKLPSQVVIHSMNTPAVMEMSKRLDSAGIKNVRIPFSRMLTSVL